MEKRGLSADHPRGVVLVQALDHDSWPETANVILDWVDLFDGTDPATRRQLRHPREWNTKLKPELQKAVAEMRRQGFDDVLVAGLMRLPVAFAIGHYFSDVAGFAVSTRQGSAIWSSRRDAPIVEVTREDSHIDQGSELAVGVSISNDLHADVDEYVRREGLPVGRIVHVQPAQGPGPAALADGSFAVGLARQVLLAVREAVRDESAARIHLFMTAPKGFALLLGNVWNRVPETVIYEDLVAEGYAPTFVLG
ncbi:MAG: SAVED domain-containing protein [Solirubrobacteraceae bacterium]